MSIRIKELTLFSDDGEEYSLALPTARVVCPGCDGEGSRTNPAFDGNGLSMELRRDRDFMDGYMSGVYDVGCSECKGMRVVDEIDFRYFKETHPDAYANWVRMQEEEAYYQAERAAEIRMGC